MRARERVGMYIFTSRLKKKKPTKQYSNECYQYAKYIPSQTGSHCTALAVW